MHIAGQVGLLGTHKLTSVYIRNRIRLRVLKFGNQVTNYKGLNQLTISNRFAAFIILNQTAPRSCLLAKANRTACYEELKLIEKRIEGRFPWELSKRRLTLKGLLPGSTILSYARCQPFSLQLGDDVPKYVGRLHLVVAGAIRKKDAVAISVSAA